MVELKDITRAPFANYDLVVYFGGGLFSIPFINRFGVGPLKLNWPKFEIEGYSNISSEVVSGLSLLFTIYILGHLLAYLGSQFIEKTFDRLLGKISTVILIASLATPRGRNEAIRALIYHRLKTIRSDRAGFPTLVRCFVHLPAFPAYFVIFLSGIFGYYNTRVPYGVIKAARERLSRLSVPGINLSIKSPWFKVL